MKKQKRTCENCRFWDASTDGGTLGNCRRRAPQVLAVSAEAYACTQFPITSVFDWCGEHEAAGAGNE